jgi:hypothetical protein
MPQTREKFVFGDQIAAVAQNLSVGAIVDRFAVDQHPVTVENHQIKTATSHQKRDYQLTQRVIKPKNFPSSRQM